jgi:hypothetical protein
MEKPQVSINAMRRMRGKTVTGAKIWGIALVDGSG